MLTKKGSMQEFTCIGNIVRDPELITTAGGQFATFTIAIPSSYSEGTDKYPETTFLKCIAFKGRGEYVLKAFSKGSRAWLSGHIREVKWQDNDGGQRSSFELVVNDVMSLDPRKSQASAAPSAPSAPSAPANNGRYPDDDLPF